MHRSTSLSVFFVVAVATACANSDGSGLVITKRPDSGVHDGFSLNPDAQGDTSGLHPPSDTGTTPGFDSSVSPPTDSGTTSFDTGTPPPFDSGSPPPPVDSGPPPGDDSTCGAMSTYNDCSSCCATNHPDGYDGFLTALAGCACTPSVCQSVCSATFCASTPTTPDSSCVTCLNDAQSGACNSAITTACGPGGPCAPYADCVNAQCASLP